MQNSSLVTVERFMTRPKAQLPNEPFSPQRTGWPAFVGLALMTLSMPLQLIIMKRLGEINKIMVKHTDARVKLANEALQGMLPVFSPDRILQNPSFFVFTH